MKAPILGLDLGVSGLKPGANAGSMGFRGLGLRVWPLAGRPDVGAEKNWNRVWGHIRV